MDKHKRERSANFTLKERDILVSLVIKYQTVLENKISNATTWKKKEAAWECITNEFNARSEGTFRSTRTLKIKYEGLKRMIRKKSAILRSELYRTEGGRKTAPPLDNIQEQIKAMIASSTDGLKSIYDSDVLPPTQESQDAIDTPIMEELIEMPPLPTETEVTDSEDTSNHRASYGTPSGKCVLTQTSHKKWDLTSRGNLKLWKSPPALIGHIQKKILFAELTQAKLELVQLQKRFLVAKIEEKKQAWEFEKNERRKESEFREKERKWKEEECKLKLYKLRKELIDT